jgi:hypothetical protein
MSDGIIIHEFEVRSYRGLRYLKTAIPPGGVIFAGPTATGKSSAIKAMLAVLQAREIKADSITLGDGSSDIRLQFGGAVDYVARRTIEREGGGKLSVGNAEATVKSPSTWLSQSFPSTLNPITLATADRKTRRAIVLEAFADLKLTREMLLAYVPDLDPKFPVDGNALEVIKAVRADYYAQRTVANSRVEQMRGDYTRLLANADRLRTLVPAGPAPALPDATGMLEVAKATLVRLENQQAEHVRSAERSADARKTVTHLREQAKTVLGTISPVAADADEMQRTALTAARSLVDRLTRELVEAKTALLGHEAALAALEKRRADNDDADRRARAIEQQAAQIEAALDSATVAEVPLSKFAEARTRVEVAHAAYNAATAAAAAVEAETRATEAVPALQELEAEATRLDRIVKDLTDTLPRTLFEQHNAIPGVSIDGDDVLVDGKRIDEGLSGREQLEFCVEIAKRATTGRSRVLIVDGLERVDGKYLPHFLEVATRGGWQLIGTRVDDGETDDPNEGMRLLLITAGGQTETVSETAWSGESSGR